MTPAAVLLTSHVPRITAPFDGPVPEATFGPRMRPFDGRAIPSFIRQALLGEQITVPGDGTQTQRPG